MEIAGYQDLVEVGRGASAIVYRARQLAFDRTVAIKVLGTSALGDSDAKRFSRECQAVGNLGWHPHVVPVYDAGVTDSGSPFLVMEYLTAGSLAQRLATEGLISEPEVVAIAIQIADALAAAHRAGVLHRDVKPGNILIGHFADVKLADFGIAALSSANTSITSTLAGTLSYMAPELLKGDRPSEACDVYSLGATMFALLANRAPFSSDRNESPYAALMRATNDPVPDLREEGVSDALSTLIERTMAKEPSSRVATATELVAELEGVASSLGLPAQTTYTARRFEVSAPDDGPASPPEPPPHELDDAPTVARSGGPPARTHDAPVESELSSSVAPAQRVEDGATVRRPPSHEPARLAREQSEPTVDQGAATAIAPSGNEGVPLPHGGRPEAAPPLLGSPGSTEPNAGQSRRVGRWFALAAAAAIAILAIAVAITNPDEGSDGGGREVAVAVGEPPVTTRPTTTTTTASDRATTTTTTEPPQASPSDILRANPAGTYGGIMSNSECTGSFTDRETACKSEQPDNPFTIRCPPTGCELSTWGKQDEDWEERWIPLQFDGDSHRGELRGVDRGWTCTNGSSQETLLVDIRTTTARYEDGGWVSTGVAGTFTSRSEPGVCSGHSITWDLIYERR